MAAHNESGRPFIRSLVRMNDHRRRVYFTAALGNAARRTSRFASQPPKAGAEPGERVARVSGVFIGSQAASVPPG